MSLRRPATYLPLLLTAAVLASPTSAPAVPAGKCANWNTPASRASKPAIRAAIVCLINKQRTHHGLPELRENRRLDHSAQNWTDRMVRSGTFTHGADFAGRLSAAGYNWGAAGENIASGFTTPWGVMRGWMASTDHCQNILSPSFSDVGVGVNTHRLGIYGPSTWTQDFGLLIGRHAPSSDRGPQRGCPYQI